MSPEGCGAAWGAGGPSLMVGVRYGVSVGVAGVVGCVGDAHPD